MDLLKIVPLNRIGLGVLLGSVLSGCSETRSTETDVQISKHSVAGSTASYDGLSIDQVFNDIGGRIPSFAGAYFDAQGLLVVRVTRLADTANAWEAVADAMTKRVHSDPKRGAAVVNEASFAPKGRRFEIADFPFTRLFELKNRIESKVFDSDDAVFLDLDEQVGRIVIGMTSASAASKSRSALALTVADDALVDMRTVARIVPTQALTLYYHQRPLAGGYEISSGSTACSLTAGVRRGSEQLALTASHCTYTWFTADGGALKQPQSGPGFGAEVTDPSTYSCGTFFQPRKCRRSDAAVYSASSADLYYSDTLAWAPGLIAQTQYSSPGSSQTNGSRDINLSNPFFTVDAEVAYPVSGEVLHKVGISSGWTYGAIYKTCVDAPLAVGTGQVRIVCSDWAAMYDQPGDSGGPVFKPSIYPDRASFYGVVFAKDGVDGVVFSNLTQIRQDLGAISLF